VRFLAVFLAVALLVGAGFGAGVALDRSAALPGSVYPEPTSVVPTFNVFWEAWDLAQQHYVDRKALDPTQMTYGAIEGMLDSLGDVGHTRFLSPETLKAEQEALSGHLEGIGAEIAIRNGQPIIVAPLPGSPAQKAGIRAGDTILKVDGKDVTTLTVDQIVNLVRGPAGTSVTLTVVHKGDTNPTDITVQRANITVPNVTWAMLPGTAVAHVLVAQFAENCTNDLISAMNDARSKGANAYVLDLRGNPGGLRDEAIGVASQFLGSGNVLIEQDAQGNRTTFPVKPGGVAVNVPLVVLIDEGTASSAEIVAGAIQDQKRAPLVGATTFGTGTVLTLFNLSDGSAIFLGTAEWFTPNGRQIWHHGIPPDIPVALPNGVAPLTPLEEGSMTAQQLQASQDTQLLRALQQVTQGH
jgi:carboxyl-terminal processing protease